ncbi:GDSL-type esterase/lipase family protein [Jiulongibacter sp. NS-SX5]|uniref:GDSL-type esterase/lipase family protein n=1 Tax=Jiulongibacter sp. NS-SX5 TaxID=3463854 RepID=UPI004057CF4C
MKNVFYTILVTLITLFFAELVLRMVVKLPDPYQHLRVKSHSTGEVIRLQNTRNTDVRFVFNPNTLWPKEEKNIVDIHINNFGFRHLEDVDTSRNEFSIFAIGGSTTQGYDYAYEKSWCQVLEKDLEEHFDQPVNVYNGGTAGAAMFDHIALLQNRVMHLKPDMVILFAGVNDVNVLVGDDNIYRFDDIYESVEAVSWYQLGLARLTLYKMYLNAKQNFGKRPQKEHKIEPEEDEIEISPNVPVQFADHLASPAATQELPMAKVMPDVNTPYYAKMVRSFIATCQVNNIPVMVMTQPTTWLTEDEELQKYHWMNKNKEFRFEKTFMQETMDIMNDDVLEISKELNVPCFDLDQVIPKNGEYFYDDCHFTPKGSVMVGNTLSTFIKDNNLIHIN